MTLGYDPMIILPGTSTGTPVCSFQWANSKGCTRRPGSIPSTSGARSPKKSSGLSAGPPFSIRRTRRSTNGSAAAASVCSCHMGQVCGVRQKLALAQTLCTVTSAIPNTAYMQCFYASLEVVAANQDARRAVSDRSCVLLGAPTTRGELRRRPQRHADSSSRLIAAIHHLQVPAQMWAGASPASPGADVGDMRSVPAAMGAVPAQMWDGVSPGEGCDHHLQPDAQLLLERRELADFRRGELETKQQHPPARRSGQDPAPGRA